MRKFLFVLYFAAFVACKKEHQYIPGSVAQKPDDSLDAPVNGPFDGLLDINGIRFVPATNPMVFLSKALGREESSGYRPEIAVSSSGWTHPSVYHSNVPWNGYTYWMAITPYPGADNQYENPHIFCSNDGINWREPAGIKNPVEPCPAAGYNSDVNLMMDNNTLYCYFRVSGVSAGRAMFVVKSIDGIHWSEKELVCEWPGTGMDVIAPSVIKDESGYQCYGICTGEEAPGLYYNTIAIRRMLSADPVKGFRPVKGPDYEIVNIDGRPWGDQQDPWHIEVQKVNNLWMMLVTTTNHGGYGAGGRLFLGYSTDGKNFRFGTRPLGNITGTYKSSFYPSYDPGTGKIHVELWRAMMDKGWVVYHDEFYIRTNLPVIV